MMTAEFIHRNAPQWIAWSYWHVECFLRARKTELGDEAESMWYGGEYTYTQDHTYTDPQDGEVLTIVPGDTFKWYPS